MAQAVRERAVWERIVAEVEAGLSHSAAAERHGVSASGVNLWWRAPTAEDTESRRGIIFDSLIHRAFRGEF